MSYNDYNYVTDFPADEDYTLPKFSSGSYATLRLRDLNGVEILEKRSKRVDYTIELEYEIGKLLNEINSDHFCRYYGLVKEPDPYSCHLVSKLLMEKIEGDSLFRATSGFTGEKLIPVIEKRSLIARTLAAASVLNEKYDISHNDLHMNNVMVRKCDEDVQAYIFPDGDEMATLTYGKSPVLVDFGFACPGKASDKMLTSMELANIGYFPHEMDKLGDARRLVYSATFIDPECLPKVVRECLHLPGVTEEGYFHGCTFPDFFEAMEKIMEKAAGRASLSRLALVSANVNLPLAPQQLTSEEIVRAFMAFRRGELLDQEEVTPNDIKYLLDDNTDELEWKFQPERIIAMQTALKTVVQAVNNIVYLNGKKASELKRKLYANSPIEKTRHVACALMPAVEYTPAMRVSVYDVASNNTVKCSFDQKECFELNSNRKTLSKILFDKLKGTRSS